MNTTKQEWPDDADGAVLRGLKEKGFDFTKPYTVDFNIDFDKWPPCTEAIDAIRVAYPNAKIYDKDGEGYVLFKADNFLTYDFVIQTQSEATELVAQYGGKCESWGVLHNK